MKSLRYSLLFLLLAAILISAAPLHKFYLSIFEFTYNEEKNAVEVTGRLFTDDLEMALEKAGADKVTITKDNVKDSYNDLIKKYLDKNVALKLDGKNVPLKFLGTEVEDDITWVYLEATEVGDYSKIYVKNLVLSEVRDKQTNIIYLFKGAEELSLLLQDGEWSGTGEF